MMPREGPQSCAVSNDDLLTERGASISRRSLFGRFL
jgi:hypothetical protein